MKWISLILIILTTTEIGFAQFQKLIPYRDGEKWGYANDKGKLVVKPQFDEVQIFRTNLAGIRKDENYALINNEGEIISDFEYDTLGYWGFGYMFGYKEKEQICLDPRGKEVSCVYGCGTGNGLGYQFQSYNKKGKIGIYQFTFWKDERGNTLHRIDTLPAIWDELIENYRGLAAVKKEKKWGIIDFNGKLIVNYIYDSISVSKNSHKYIHFFKIELDEKVGFLNIDGEPLIQPIYHKADFFMYGLAKVWIDENYWGYIDQSGREFFTRKKDNTQEEE